MLAGLALAIGSVVLLRRGNRKQAGLMAIAAAVMFVNVAIWTVPNSDGASLTNSARMP